MRGEGELGNDTRGQVDSASYLTAKVYVYPKMFLNDYMKSSFRAFQANYRPQRNA